MLPNPGAVIYGTITVGALLAAESARTETYGETLGGVLLALLVYWLAHGYSEFTEHRLEENQAVTLSGLVHTLVHELMIIAGAAIPLLTLVICWIVRAGLDTAVSAAVWTSAGVIVGVEVAAGVRAHLTGRALAAQAAVGALFGLLVIALKLVLH
jgi:hypothetical protein